MKQRNLEVLNPLLRKSHVHTETTKHDDDEWLAEVEEYLMTRKPVVYMMVGVAGAGKSTFAASLQNDNPRAVYISTDQFIEDYAASVGKTYTDVYHEYCDVAADLMFKAVDDAVASGNDIIWDQTNLTVKARRRKLSRLHDYKKIAVVIETQSDLVYERIKNRPGKHISKNLVMQMELQYQKPTVSEGFESIIFRKG